MEGVQEMVVFGPMVAMATLAMVLSVEVIIINNINNYMNVIMIFIIVGENAGEGCSYDVNLFDNNRWCCFAFCDKCLGVVCNNTVAGIPSFSPPPPPLPLSISLLSFLLSFLLLSFFILLLRFASSLIRWFTSSHVIIIIKRQ